MKITIENRTVEINDELVRRFESIVPEKVDQAHVKMYIELCTQQKYSKQLLDKITDEELNKMMEIGLHMDLLEPYDTKGMSNKEVFEIFKEK